MTPEHCRAILEHLPVIRAIAEGRDVYFCAFDYRGKFIEWRRSSTVSLGPLCAGFYSVKPRYQCIRPDGKPKAIPYPKQRESVRHLDKEVK